MDNFEYSLWVFHKDFILSVLLTAVGLFLLSFAVSAIGTSQRFRRALHGPDPAEVELGQYRRSLIDSMHEEINLILSGRKVRELNEDEASRVRQLREQYFLELRKIGGSNGQTQ
jgi:hypothetical protein